MVAAASSVRPGRGAADTPDSDGAGAVLVCTVCVRALTPRSTLPNRFATGTWWLPYALEHEAEQQATGGTDVLLCHGGDLAVYRPTADNRLRLIDHIARPTAASPHPPACE